MSSNLDSGSPSGDNTNAPPLQRRDSELTAESEYDQVTLDLVPPSEHEMGVYRDGVSGNLQLLSSADKTPLYFVRNSVFRPGVPDVTIFTGSDKNGAVVGVCNYAAFSTTITFGRGDPEHPNGMEWEQLSKTSHDHSLYKFSVLVRGEERKSYSWLRKQDPEIQATESSSNFGRRSWKLQDDATGQVMAVFAAKGIKKGWKKVGKFRLLATEGKEWEEWVLLSFCGLYEKARQRAIARRDLSWFF